MVGNHGQAHGGRDGDERERGEREAYERCPGEWRAEDPRERAGRSDPAPWGHDAGRDPHDYGHRAHDGRDPYSHPHHQSGSGGSDRGRGLTAGLRELLERPNVRSFLWGVGTAAAAGVLWPALRPTLRPIAVRAAASVIQFADSTLAAVARAREDIEDVVAEARAAAREERAPRRAAEAADDDLRATVATLQAEFREMREMLQKFMTGREAS